MSHFPKTFWLEKDALSWAPKGQYSWRQRSREGVKERFLKASMDLRQGRKVSG